MRVAGLALVLALCLPTPGRAQWVEPPGQGWTSLSLYHHDTRRRFDPRRNVEPLFNEGGRAVTTSLFWTGVVGIVRGADVWIQIPFNRLRFDDVAAERESVGFGDPRVHLRLGPAVVGLPAVPVAVRGGIKLPLGRFNRDAEIIPLSEGQRDLELMVEAGHSFYPAPVYVAGWAGYRWRAFNDEIGRKPGDETFGFAAVGGAWRGVAWKLAAEALYGQAPRRRLAGVEIPLEQDRRELIQLMPSLGYGVGPGRVEAGLRMPVYGRNLPAGPAFFIGYFSRIDLW